MSVTELEPQGKTAPLLTYSRMVDISLVLDQSNFKMQVLDGFEKDAQFELEVVKPYSHRRRADRSRRAHARPRRKPCRRSRRISFLPASISTSFRSSASSAMRLSWT